MSERIDWITRIAIYGMFFSLAISRSLFTLCAVLAVLTWVMSGEFSSKWEKLRTNPSACLMLTFVAYVFVRAAFGEVGGNTSGALSVYWKLVLIPIIAITVIDRGTLKRCWVALCMGMTVLLMHVYVLAWWQPPWSKSTLPDQVFFNPLPQAVALAIFSGWCAYQATEVTSKWGFRLAYALGFVAASGAVLYVSQQRLGFLVWALLIVSVAWTRVPRNLRACGLSIALLGLAVLLGSNETFRERMTTGISEAQSYDGTAAYTSIGARLHMWKIARDNILDSPLFGFGAGSYSIVAERSFNDAIMCSIGCIHPHNQYLHIWIEHGLVGMLLFFGSLCFAIAANVNRSALQPFGIPLMLVFFFCSVVETPLWYRGFLYLFVPILGVLLARVATAPRRIWSCD